MSRNNSWHVCSLKQAVYMLCGCIVLACSGQAPCCVAAPGDRWHYGPQWGGKGAPMVRINCKDRCNFSLRSQRPYASHCLFSAGAWSCWSCVHGAAAAAAVGLCHAVPWNDALCCLSVSLCLCLFCIAAVPLWPLCCLSCCNGRIGMISDRPLIKSELSQKVLTAPLHSGSSVF